MSTSYIFSNKIELLVNNKLKVNDKYIISGTLMEFDDILVYEFKPFSGYEVGEEKDCINDIAVFLSSKLKTTYNTLYTTSSHFNNKEGRWIIQFDPVKNKNNFPLV